MQQSTVFQMWGIRLFKAWSQVNTHPNNKYSSDTEVLEESIFTGKVYLGNLHQKQQEKKWLIVYLVSQSSHLMFVKVAECIHICWSSANSP